MSESLIITIVVIYFSLLFLVSQLTKGKSDNKTFFSGNKESPWYVVAFGMVKNHNQFFGFSRNVCSKCKTNAAICWCFLVSVLVFKPCVRKSVLHLSHLAHLKLTRVRFSCVWNKQESLCVNTVSNQCHVALAKRVFETHAPQCFGDSRHHKHQR